MPVASGPLTVGIVLAAGAARRMGGRAKGLIERDGVPLVRRTALALLDAGVDEVVVVTGHEAEAVGAALDRLPVRIAHNADYAAGRTGSLRAGLRALPTDTAVVVVALADQPLLEADDVASLLEAFARRGAARVVAPRVAGERGHPLIVEHGVCRTILADAADVGVRQWMDAHPAQVAWLDGDNDHYWVDVDEPQDLERIARRYGCQLRWQ